MRIEKKILIILALGVFQITLCGKAFSQAVYQHISSEEIYLFLDELASERVIELNAAVKPYSRKYIAEQLKIADSKRDELSKRMQAELDFYLKDYNKELKPDKNFKKRYDLFYYKDSLFTFSANPIMGIYYLSNDSGGTYHRWNGAEGFAYIGDNFGFYANLRDNYEREAIAHPEYINPYYGGNFKGSGRIEKHGVEYSEMRGGITYDWKWGTIGLVKDHFVWGTNYNGANIFSGKTPSFAHIKLQIHPAKWIEFNYVHGWLVSEVIDSARSYTYLGQKRDVFRNKYLAANLLTFKPWQGLNISIGNSIIYSDMGVHPAYLIPVMFYKSVDHTYNSATNAAGQNSQMFGEISFRMIKHLHLYATLFVDEVSISRMWEKDDHTNFMSLKGGFCLSNMIKDLSFVSEITLNNPIVYEHYMITTTFESNQYNLGNYLRHNAREIFLSLRYKPLKNLSVKASYTYAEKGEDYVYGVYTQVRGLPLVSEVKWKSQQIDLLLSYQIVNDAYIFLGFKNSKIGGEDVNKYTPHYLQGNLNSYSVGLNINF